MQEKIGCQCVQNEVASPILRLFGGSNCYPFFVLLKSMYALSQDG